jgi:hypothetical protein
MREILIRAGGKNGHIVTASKAALIIASGGQVTVCAVNQHDSNILGIEARVYGQNGPKVGFSARGRMSLQDAELMASVIAKAAELAAKSQADTVNWFEHIPGWVTNRFAVTGLVWDEKELSREAACRYRLGDVDVNEAWLYAVEYVEQKRENETEGGQES